VTGAAILLELSVRMLPTHERVVVHRLYVIIIEHLAVRDTLLIIGDDFVFGKGA